MAHRPLQIAGSALITGLLLTAALAVTAPGLRDRLGWGTPLAADEPLNTPPADPVQLATSDLPVTGESTPLVWPRDPVDSQPFPAAHIGPVLADAPSGASATIIPASRTGGQPHLPRREHLGFEALPPPPDEPVAPPLTAERTPAPAAAGPIDLLVNELTLLRQDLQRIGPPADPAAEVRSEVQSLKAELAALAEQRRLDALQHDVARLAARQDTLETRLETPAVAQVPEPVDPAPLPVATELPAHIEFTPTATDASRFDVRLTDADPALVVRRLGELGGGNLALSSAVQGRVNLSLSAVTPEEAVQSVAAALGCALVDEGPVRLLLPLDHAAARQSKPGQTIARLIRPAYISAQDLVPLVLPLLTPQLGEVGVTPVHPAEGDPLPRAQADALLVADLPHVVAQVEAMLCEVDVPPEQFIIEAVITTVTWNQRTACGVVPALQQEGVCSAPLRRDRQSTRGRTGQIGQFRGRPQELLARLGQMAELHIEATPTLQVLNRQLAEVEVGANVAYRQSVAFGKRLRLMEEEIDFLPSRTQLSVRPFLQGGETVRLQVHPRVTHVHPDPVSRLPREEIAELATDITIPLGCTAVIGGLTRSSDDTSPALTSMERWLGKRRGPGAGPGSLDDTVELVILLTPRRANEVVLPSSTTGAPATEPAPLPPTPPAARPTPSDYMPPALPELPPQPAATAPGWFQRVLGDRRQAPATPAYAPPPVDATPAPARTLEFPPLPELPPPVLEEPLTLLAPDRGDWSTLAAPEIDLAHARPIPVEYAPVTVRAASATQVIDPMPPEPAASSPDPAAPLTETITEAPLTFVPPEPAPARMDAVVDPATLDLSQVPPPPPDVEFSAEPLPQPATFIPPLPDGRPRRAQRDHDPTPRRAVQRREWHMEMEEPRRR